MTFDPFAGAPNPAGEAAAPTEDDVDFDQFLTTLQEGGFNYGGQPVAEPTADDSNAPTVPAPVDDDGGDHANDTPAEQPVHSDAPTGPTVELNGQQVPLAQVQLLYELGKTITEQGLTPGSTPAPRVGTSAEPVAPVDNTPVAPVEPVIPDFIDQTDPVQMGLWKRIEGLENSVTQTNQATQRQLAIAERAKVESDIDAGIAAFRTEHPDITDDDINVIRPLAAHSVNAWVTTTGNPVDGVSKAMFAASLDLPTTRDKVLGTSHNSGQDKSTRRKNNLSSITGGTGGGSKSDTPRSPASSDRQAREQFATELAKTFGQNGSLR